MSQPQVDAVILDMGNVLIFHDNDVMFRAFAQRSGLEAAEVERRLGQRGLWEAINRGHLDSEGIWREVSRALEVSIPAPEFAQLWSCHFTVHDAVMPHVRALKGKVKRVLLSNTNALHVEYCRRELPILEDLDALLFSNEAGLVKPEREFYEKAAQAAGVPAARCVFFDDVETYVTAARNAGLQARVFTTAEQFQKDLAAFGL